MRASVTDSMATTTTSAPVMIAGASERGRSQGQ
jgi:hypothetical protein